MSASSVEDELAVDGVADAPLQRAPVGWEYVARWLGNDYQTCVNHYVRAGDGDLELARGALAGH